MFTINHDHSYIRDEPDFTITNDAGENLIIERTVDSPATNTVFNNEDNVYPPATKPAMDEDVPQHVQDLDAHMDLHTVDEDSHNTQDGKGKTSDAANEEDIAVSEEETGVVNTEYTVLESGDLESIDDDHDRTILVYKEFDDASRYVTRVGGQEGGAQNMLYLDQGASGVGGEGTLTGRVMRLDEAGGGVPEETDTNRYGLYSIAETELTVNECDHDMNVDGICQKCGELDLSLLGDAGTEDAGLEGSGSGSSGREPVVLKIDVYDRYGERAAAAAAAAGADEEDLDELDESSELQGTLVLSIEIKVNPDLSTGYYSGKMYLCNVNCAFYTTDAVNMLNHFRQHHGEYVYEYTMYEFKRYMISLSHSFRHTHPDYCPRCAGRRADAVMFMRCRRFRYLCRACRFSAKGNHPLVDHLQVHAHQQYHCQLCRCACPAKRPLADHLRQRHAAQGRLFVGLPPQPTERAPDAVVPWASVRRTKKKRKRAKQRVPRSSPCKCPKCDFAADSHTELMNHLVMKHIKKYTLLRRKPPGTATTSSTAASFAKQLIVCNFCQFRTVSRPLLERHVAIRHADMVSTTSSATTSAASAGLG